MKWLSLPVLFLFLLSGCLLVETQYNTHENGNFTFEYPTWSNDSSADPNNMLSVRGGTCAVTVKIEGTINNEEEFSEFLDVFYETSQSKGIRRLSINKENASASSIYLIQFDIITIRGKDKLVLCDKRVFRVSVSCYDRDFLRNEEIVNRVIDSAACK